MPILHETIARDTIHGQTDEIQGLINPVNDGNLAAWMMALDRAQRMVGTLQAVCDAISARPMLNPGQQALRLIAQEDGTDFYEVMSPELDAAFDELEARASHVHPVFAPLLDSICPRPPFPTVPHLQAGA